MISAEEIKELGIVGAGGAGFPTYVKLSGKAEIFIVNAAECEPLLHKDKELLRLKTGVFFKGLMTCLDLVSAKRCIIGVKAKYTDLIAHLKKQCPNPDRVEIVGLRDFYPVGDEITLIYETTGRIVPPGALPISQNVIVNNVETIYNIGLNTPLVTKFITIGGDVKRPLSVEAPIGISYRELIALAEPNHSSRFSDSNSSNASNNSNMTLNDIEVIVGGPMMGKLADSLDDPVTKTTGGLLVFAKDHPLIQRFKTAAVENQVNRIGKSACDQCAICSELCPRHLLGHPIEPHKAMRSLMFTPLPPCSESATKNRPVEPHTMSCCECNLCTLLSCPEGLYPAQRAMSGKRHAMAAKAQFKGKVSETAHPLIDYRRTPITKIMARLDLMKFQNKGTLTPVAFTPKKLVIRLNQHIGAPAVPIIKAGDAVEKYQKIATVGDKLGAELHAPASGQVVKVDADNQQIVIETT